MKVLVVKLSAMGDILHAMPAVRRLILEGHETSWAVDARYAKVLDLFPGLARVHVLDPKVWGRAVRQGRIRQAVKGFSDEIGSLRRIGYDVALDLQGLLKSGIIARLTRAGRTVGFEMRACRERAAAVFYGERIPVDLDLPVTEQILRTAATALGFSPRRAEAGLVVPEDGYAAAEALLDGASPFVLVIGAGWPTKVLPAPTFRRVAEALSPEGPVVALSGSEAERDRAQAIVRDLPRTQVLDRLPLPTLAGLLERARVVIGGDTGLVHLAALLGTPTVSLYGASLGARSGPEGPGHRHIQSRASCSPCFSRTCGHVECMEELGAEQILDAVRSLQSGGGRGSGR